MRRTAVRSMEILLLAVVLLCSCVTGRPYGEEQYFQGLGLDGEFVITVNADLLDLDQYIVSDDAAVNYIKDRMSRLSIALNSNAASEDAVMTADFTEYDFYGAVEGSYPKSLVNTALTLSKMLSSSKDPESGLKFYVDEQSKMEIAVPDKGIILFSSKDVVDNYKRTYVKDRPKNISDEDAAKLASSQVGIYVANPKTMLDLGLDITKESLENISSVLLVMDEDKVSIDFRLKSEDLASSFSILVKAGYIGNLRRNGEKADIAKLKEMFTQELDSVHVNGMELSGEQKASIMEVITSLLTVL